MTVYEAQSGDHHTKDGQSRTTMTTATTNESAPKLPGKVTLVQSMPSSTGSTCKMAFELKSPESTMDMHLVTMISELSVNGDRRQPQPRPRPSRHDDDDEDEDEEDDGDVSPHDDDDEAENQESEDVLYTDRGPMMGGRHPGNRKHPYETGGSGVGSHHHGEAASPSSSSEANDSESSMMSSPGSSPRHSVSIQIPSRHHIGSFGTVTVVVPVPQPRLAGDSPEPVDPSNNRRHSLCTGGGLVIPENTVERKAQQQQQQQQQAEGIISPSNSQQMQQQQQHQSLLAGLAFPMLTIVPSHGMIEFQQPPSTGHSPSHQYSNAVDEAQYLSMQSPYGGYRDRAPSGSPASVHSPLADDSCLATPSPLSDMSMQQPSPYGSVDLQHEIFDPGSLDGISAFQSLLTKSRSSSVHELQPPSMPLPPPPPMPMPIGDVNVDSDLVPFLDCNIDEMVKNLVDDLGVPDKLEFDLYGSVSPIESESQTARQQDGFVVPKKPPLPPSKHQDQQQQQQQQPQQQQQQQQQQHCSGRVRRCSNPDIETKIMAKMNSFKKILPKNDVVGLAMATPKPVSVEPTTAAVCAQATGVDAQTVMSGKIYTSAVTASVEKFANAVERMRNQFDDDERNFASGKVDQWTVDDLCKPDDNGDTYLHIAICQNKAAIVYAIVNRLVRNNRSLDIGNKTGQTPLFVAVAVQRSVFVEFLLHHGANAGCICRDGTTPLHIVASRGDSNYEVAELLCSSKTVGYSYRNGKGLTALHCAVQSQNKALRIGQLLARCGSSLTDQEYRSGKTPLHLAVEKGDVAMVKALGEAVPMDKMTSALRAVNYVHDTPLHSAAMIRDLTADDRLELIRVLLSFGANPALKNNDHKLPRDLLPPDSAANKTLRKALDPKSIDSK